MNEPHSPIARRKARLREERTFSVGLEIRADGDKPTTIVGHPAKYNVWSEDMGGFRERIRPGAFTKTIAESDIRALFNHDPNFVLGRNTAGTLELRDESAGLHMVATPPDTQTVRDLVLEPMRRGDINQMSFAFRVAGPAWVAVKDEKPPQGVGEIWNADFSEREIVQAQLYDVSVVSFPAYPQTDASVRASIGLLDGVGIDWAALTACLTRAERGLPLLSSDRDLIEGSVAVLRSFIPPEPEPEAATTHAEPQAGPSLAHLRALLDLEAASV